MTFLTSLLTFGFDTASPLRFWHATFAFLYGTLGLSANSLLIWLVRSCKQPELIVYSRIMLTTANVDILYLLISMVARYGENMVSPERADQFIYGYGVLNWDIFQWTPTLVNYVVGFGWLIGLYYCQWSLAVQFLFRYFIIVHGITLSYLQYGLLLFLLLLLELPLWGVMVYNSFGRTMQLEFITDANQIAIFNGGSAPSANNNSNGGGGDGVFDKIRICWYNYNVNSDLFQAWSWVHLGYQIIFYTVICFCTVSIYWAIRQHTKKQTNKMAVSETSRQITLVLGLQAILPLFFTFAPTIYIKLTNLFGATPLFASFGLLLGMWNPWLSVLNPLICIVCIGRYRRKCCSIFLRWIGHLAQIGHLGQSKSAVGPVQAIPTLRPILQSSFLSPMHRR